MNQGLCALKHPATRVRFHPDFDPRVIQPESSGGVIHVPLPPRALREIQREQAVVLDAIERAAARGDRDAVLNGSVRLASLRARSAAFLRSTTFPTAA